MAKKSMVERDLKRRRLAKKFESKRTRLKEIINDKEQAGRRPLRGRA